MTERDDLWRRLAVADRSAAGEARRLVGGFCTSAGLQQRRGEIELAVTELATNLLSHAQRGALYFRVSPEPDLVEVLAIDRGPGIANTRQIMHDGFSTAGTLGIGLGMVRRSADRFGIESHLHAGTTVWARWYTDLAAVRETPNAVQIGTMCRALSGQTACGDGWCWSAQTQTLLVVDGLGHGPRAQDAAIAARQTFAELEGAAPPLPALMDALHSALAPTRGAAATLIRIDSAAREVAVLGMGNIGVRLFEGRTSHAFARTAGIVGQGLRRSPIHRCSWSDDGAVLVAHSDGIRSRWAESVDRRLLAMPMPVVAGAIYRDHERFTDDAVVVCMRLPDRSPDPTGSEASP